MYSINEQQPIAPSLLAAFQELIDDKPPAFSLREVLTTMPRLRKKTLLPRAALLGEWMREGDFGYIYAPRGHGKTWLAMMMANALADHTGMGLWSKGTRSRKVIYFDAEMNLPDVQERANCIDVKSDNFQLLQNELVFEKMRRGLNIAEVEDQALISEMLDDGDVFLIDNLSTAASGLSENDNDSFDSMKGWLLSLRGRGITVIIVHHAGRNGEMRGASRREDMAHWILSLKEDGMEGEGTAWITQFKKCRNCASLDAPPLRWTLTIHDNRAETTCQRHSGTDAMLALIRTGVENATDLAEELGVTNGCVSKWAKKLSTAGLIHIRNRRYVPA